MIPLGMSSLQNLLSGNSVPTHYSEVWECTACTYKHSTEAEKEYLACTVCSTPRATGKEKLKESKEENKSLKASRKRKRQINLGSYWISKSADDSRCPGIKTNFAAQPSNLRSINEVLKCRDSSSFYPLPKLKFGKQIRNGKYACFYT